MPKGNKEDTKCSCVWWIWHLGQVKILGHQGDYVLFFLEIFSNHRNPFFKILCPLAFIRQDSTVWRARRDIWQNVYALRPNSEGQSAKSLYFSLGVIQENLYFLIFLSFHVTCSSWIAPMNKLYIFFEGCLAQGHSGSKSLDQTGFPLVCGWIHKELMPGYV